MIPDHLVDAQAERYVCGCMLLDFEAARDLAYLLSPGDLYREQERRIFTAAAEGVMAGDPADMVVVSRRLEASGKSWPGIMSDLAALMAEVPTTANARYYAGIVVEHARVRRLWMAAQQIQDTIGSQRGMTADEAVSESERLISEARNAGNATTSSVWASEVVEERWRQHLDPGAVMEGVSTGLSDVDEFIGGLRKGELMVVAGRPSMGKTAFALRIAREVARHSPVLLVSLETSRRTVADRLICLETGLSQDVLRQKRYGSVSLTRHQDEIDRLIASQLFVVDRRGTTSEQVEAEAWRMSRSGLGLVVIDYLTLLADRHERGMSTSDHIGAISRRLQAMAGNLDVPVIVLSQLNRDVERREGNRPTMADLRDSGQVEQDAHAILMLYRPEYYKREPRGVCEVIIAKQKDGPVGVARVGYRPECGQFFDLARQTDGQQRGA